MGTARRLTEARLAEILRRQDPPQFGVKYEPSIKATRTEAPANSRPAWVWSDRLGRYVSTLSAPERAVLAIILQCSWMFELHEQRMLPILPSPHPLHGHPFAYGIDLPQARGTLAIANDLSFLRFHPVVSREAGGSGKSDQVPGCFIGDFLLFLQDHRGPFCRNINVKQTREEFEVPVVGVSVKTDLTKARAREMARHEIERENYREIDIATVEVASDELPEILVSNLQQLQNWQRRDPQLSDEDIEIVLAAFQDALENEVSPLDVMTVIQRSRGISTYQQKIVLYQAVFTRKLRIDLFESYFYINKPMRLEHTNVLEEYAHWFRRAA